MCNHPINGCYDDDGDGVVVMVMRMRMRMVMTDWLSNQYQKVIQSSQISS